MATKKSAPKKSRKAAPKKAAAKKSSKKASASSKKAPARPVEPGTQIPNKKGQTGPQVGSASLVGNVRKTQGK